MKKLDEYRKKRNIILHDLFYQMKSKNFNKSLEDICSLGDEIISSKKFMSIEYLLDLIEEKAKWRLEKLGPEQDWANY